MKRGKYEGEIVWDKPNGKGKFIYDDVLFMKDNLKMVVLMDLAHINGQTGIAMKECIKMM